MTRTCALTWIVALGALVAARQQPSPAQTFRAGVDIIQLDVSVLDKKRQPVRGLSAGDFTVTIDGVPRQVVAFTAVDLPAPAPPPAAWMRDVPPDVATNTHPSGRVVVIMLDDGSFGGVGVADVLAVEKMRAVAHAAVDELGPDDSAAVVYSENNRTAQSLTTDRTRLQRAIDRSLILPSNSTAQRVDTTGGLPSMTQDQADRLNDPNGVERGSCLCGLCSIEALQHVAESLQSVSGQRKVLLYISNGVPVTLERSPTVEAASGYDNAEDVCNTQRRLAMVNVFRAAQLANVTIQAVDPNGLSSGRLRTEYLRTMAETTGGRAVVNELEMQDQVPALFSESRAYYLVGVERPATKDDGRVHPIKVSVSRPGLEVRTQSGYYVPSEKELKALAARPGNGAEAAIAAALPKSDFPLDVSIAPFAAGKKADVAVVLFVTQPIDPADRRASRTEAIRAVITAIDVESGKRLGTWHEGFSLAWTASDATAGLYELMTRVPLPPGRFDLRLGVETGNGRSSSVYTSVEVPDFSDGGLSMSGVVLSAVPSPRLAPKNAFTSLMPIPPTARRTFRPGDRLSGFVRLYQGGSGPLTPVTMTTRLIDGHDRSIGEGVKHVTPSEFGRARVFDDPFNLPSPLPSGDYLLEIDAAAGGRSLRRTVRFHVL
jgi:VWFA-related protein